MRTKENCIYFSWFSLFRVWRVLYSLFSGGENPGIDLLLVVATIFMQNLSVSTFYY